MLTPNQTSVPAWAVRGTLVNGFAGDFVLVSCDIFRQSETLCLYWCGWRTIIKVISYFAFSVEDLRTEGLSAEDSSGLKFYSENCFHMHVLVPHVLSFKAGMQVQCLLQLIDTPYSCSRCSLKRPLKRWGFDHTVATRSWRRASNAP